MAALVLRRSRHWLAAGTLLAAMIAGVPGAWAQQNGSSFFPGSFFVPGNLVVTRSVYTNGNNIMANLTNLPPGCTPATTANPMPTDPCTPAVTSSAYPYVFNNDTVDGSFGVTQDFSRSDHSVRISPRLRGSPQ